MEQWRRRVGRRLQHNDVVLGLVDLPAVSRFPRVMVNRREQTLELLFLGPRGSRQMELPLAPRGELDDLEAVELRLLASLQALGYVVMRVGI